MNAAKAAFADYLNDAILDSRQIYFVNQIVEYIVRNGVMKDLSVLQKLPFTDKGSVVEALRLAGHPGCNRQNQCQRGSIVPDYLCSIRLDSIVNKKWSSTRWEGWKMAGEQRRHDIHDRAWKRIGPHH